VGKPVERDHDIDGKIGSEIILRRLAGRGV
jgi:hypothetical protein